MNKYKWVAVAIIIFTILGTIFLRKSSDNPLVVEMKYENDSLKVVNDSLNYVVLELKDECDHLKEEISMLKAEKGIY